MISIYNLFIIFFLTFFPFIYSISLFKKSIYISFGILSYWSISIFVAYLSEIFFFRGILNEILILLNILFVFVLIFNSKNLSFNSVRDNSHYFLFLFVIFIMFSIFLEEYFIYAWDEFAKILYWTKSIYSSNIIYNDYLSTYISGDKPGLPILYSLPSLIFGQYFEKYLVIVYFSFHLALISLLFESLNRLNRNFKLNLLFVLIFLVLEISWKVIPENLLYENIQIYLFSSIFIIIFLFQKKLVSNNFFIIYLILLSTLSYFIKSTYITFFPVLIFYLLLIKIPMKHIIFFFIFMILVYFLFNFNVTQNRCQVNPLLGFSLNEFYSLFNLSIKILHKLFFWLLSWKLALTFILIFISLYLSFINFEIRIAFLIFILWFLLYLFAVTILMNNCFTIQELKNLFAVERYFLIIFRTFHIIVIFFIFYHFYDKFDLLFNKLITPLNLILLILLFFQIYQSIQLINHRENLSESYKYKLIKFKEEFNNEEFKNSLTDEDKNLFILLNKYYRIN